VTIEVDPDEGPAIFPKKNARICRWTLWYRRPSRLIS
jgi:hypothetical protein